MLFLKPFRSFAFGLCALGLGWQASFSGIPSAMAADLPGYPYQPEPTYEPAGEDETDWDFEVFGRMFFLLNDFGAAAAPGGGIIGRSTDTGAIPSGSDLVGSTISLADAGGADGNLYELGGVIYRNRLGVNASVLFTPGSGGGGYAQLGPFQPLRNASNGQPGGVNIGGSVPSSEAPFALGGAPSPELLIGSGLSTGPFGIFIPANNFGGISVAAQSSKFRSYQMNAIFRDDERCGDNEDCVCDYSGDDSPECESRWQVRAGLRHFEFGEAYDVQMEAYLFSNGGGTIPGTYYYTQATMAGMNKIYGFQIGGQYKILRNVWDRLDLQVDASIGYGINDYVLGASGASSIPTSPTTNGPVVGYNNTVDGREGTLFGELDLSASWDVTHNVELSLGYRGLWIEKVADVGANISNISIDPTAGGSASLGDMMMHMGRIGIAAKF